MQPAIDRARVAVAIPGYEILEELERSGAFALFRAARDANGAKVLIKTPRRDPLRAAPVLQREFQILRSARVAALPTVHELFHEPWALVMDDPGGSRLPRPFTPATSISR